MRTLTLLTALIMSAACCFAAPDTTRILYIGNSFTATYDVPGIVNSLALKAGLPVKYSSYTPGGVSVGDVSQGTSAHMNNPAVFDLIRSQPWDYVVLQDNQGRFMYGGGIFPAVNLSKVVEGHLKIADSVQFYHACAHTLFFAGWAFKTGYPGIANTGTELIDNIYENYRVLNDSAEQIISPIGIAWKRCLSQLPAIDLWGPDETHESPAGAYLTAAVIFTSVFKINTEKVSYVPGGLDSTSARTMRRIAYQSVADSITGTGLIHYTPELNYGGGTLTAPAGYSSYSWLKDNVVVSTGTSRTLAVTSLSGCYQVIVTDNKGCKYRSMEQCLNTLAAPEINAVQLQVKVYPNPVADMLTIDAGGNGLMKWYTITDLTGNVVCSGQFTGSTAAVAMRACSSGMYLLTLHTDGAVFHEKIMRL